ncbi:MAG: GEVED domain-containing protein [Bacteroidales bacterium]
MRKIVTILLMLVLLVTHGFGQAVLSPVTGPLQNPQINTRIDNLSYWTKLAEMGLIPYNPVVPVEPATKLPSKNSSKFLDQMSADILIYDEAGVTQSENSVYVDPDNVQKVFNSNNSESGGGVYGADYFNSTNSAQTWSGSKFGTGGANDGDPAACIDLNGRQYSGFITAAEGQGIAYSDNGTTWTPVTLAAGVAYPNLLDKNHLTVDNTSSAYTGNVYSAWTCFLNGDANNTDIVFSRSTNHGVGWSSQLNISNAIAAGSHNQGVNLQVGPAGQVYACWAVYDTWSPTFFENAIGFAKSTNGGASFAAATRIHNNIHGIRPSPNTPTTNVTGKNMRVNSFPSMAVDVSGGAYNGNVYIVWSNLGVPGTNTGTNVSVYCMRSTNGGTTWGTPVRVNQGPSANDYASFFPWITCDPVTGKLFCIFYDDRYLGTASTALETWMASSEDGGLTWTDTRVGDVSFTPAPIAGLAAGYFGDYLGITARNNWVYPVWTDNRSGRALTYCSPVHFSDYCVAAGGCDEYISHVTMGSINNGSTCEGYQNFTGLSTNLPINTSVPITVTNGSPFSSDQCGIWIDWNNDGDFADANETISVTGTPGPGTYTSSIAPPVGTAYGPKTMRIRITYTGALSACGDTQYGEVEDYTVNVTTPAPNYWTGAFNHYWHNAANWSLGHIPTAVEDVYITNAGYQPVYVDVYAGTPAEESKVLTVQAGGALQVWGMTLNVNSDLNIYGSLTMTNAAGIINVTGNWTDYAGAAGFTEGPGRVVFNGPGHQYILSSENFNILEAKMGAALRINNATTTVTCNQYDWTTGGIDVLAGTFNVLDLYDSGLFGTYWVNGSGALNITQDAAQYTDLRGEIHIYGGTMTVTGGLGASFWPYINNATIEMSAGVLDFKNNGIYLNGSPTLTENITGGTIRTNGSFYGARTDFTPSGGTVELYGTTDVTLSYGLGSNFANLLINKAAVLSNAPQSSPEIFYDRSGNIVNSPLTSGVNATSDLVILGNLTIQTGTLVAPASIQIAGNWTNNVGTTGFTEGAGMVSFNGTGHQYCYGETFNTLELNKPVMDLHIPTGTTTTCQSYDWTSGELEVEGGTFIANDLADNGIYGKYYITASGGLLELHQDAAQYIDLDGRIVISAGTMNVYGGTGYSVWPYATDAAIWMYGGVLDFKTGGIYIYNSPSYALDDIITGGVIRTASGFYGERADFTPTAGTFEFYGSSNVTLYELNGCKLFNVNINKGAKSPGNPISGTPVSDARFSQILAPGSASNSALLSTDFTIANDLTISSGYFVPNGHSGIVKNYCHVYGSLEMTNAADKLYVGTDSYDNLEFHAGSNSTLSAGEIYPASWVYSSGAATVNGTAGNTIYFTGTNVTGLDIEGPGSVFGNIDFNKPSVLSWLNSYSGNVVELAGNLTMHPDNILSMQGTSMTVHGTVTDDPTSSIYLHQGYDNPGSQVNHGAMLVPPVMHSPATIGNFIIDPAFTLNGLLDVADCNALVHGIFHLANTGNLTISSGSFIADASNHAKGWEYLEGHISLASGLFEITHNSIQFADGATSTITGGIMRSGEAFAAINTGNFLPTGGTVEITGTGSNTIYCDGGNFFHNLLINRNAGSSSFLFTPITVNNTLTVNGGYLNFNGNVVNVSGGVSINIGATLLNPSGTLQLAGGTTLNVNSGGTLSVTGDLAFPATISRISTGNYAFNVQSGGTVSAHDATFQYMDANGINFLAGSLVDPANAFTRCTFQNGASGGTLLKFNNSQVMTIRNAVFPANTWTGASNVSKTVNAGHVYFVDFSGAFSGEAFDGDSFNLLDWVPTLTATATSTVPSVCAGSSTQLNITRTGGLAPFTYVWSPATGLSNPSIVNPVATPLATTTYNVTVTDALGSTATSSILVTVNPLLPVSVSISPSANPVPPGTLVTFTATPVNGGALPGYQWKVNGVNIVSGSPTFSYVPSNNDHVTCVLTSNAVCPTGNPATSNSIAMIVVVTNASVTGSIPGPMSLCFDASNTITVAGGGSTFVVQSGASATMIAGVKISYLYGTTVLPGGYMHGYITSTNSYCGALPASMVTLTSGSEEGLSDPNLSSRFAIYPNPTTGVFTLQDRSEQAAGNIQVEIYDMRGDRILSKTCSGEKTHTFTLADFATGLYFVKVISGDKVESFKLVVAR